MIVSDVNLEWESEQAHSSLLERTEAAQKQ